MLWGTSLVLYTQTPEGTAEKWVSGQAVLCGNSPDVPASNVLTDHTSHLEKRTTWIVLVDPLWLPLFRL